MNGPRLPEMLPFGIGHAPSAPEPSTVDGSWTAFQWPPAYARPSVVVATTLPEGPSILIESSSVTSPAMPPTTSTVGNNRNGPIGNGGIGNENKSALQMNASLPLTFSPTDPDLSSPVIASLTVRENCVRLPRSVCQSRFGVTSALLNVRLGPVTVTATAPPDAFVHLMLGRVIRSTSFPARSRKTSWPFSVLAV